MNLSKLNRRIFSCTLAILLTGLSANGQAVKETKRPAEPKQTPAHFLPPEVQEGLPHVLLIGDSISIGYMLAAREQLKGEANVWRPPTNCGPTTRGLESLHQWLGDRKWDVVHFNFGLHDLKYMGADNSNLADPNDKHSHQQVPLEEYFANLKQIAQRLKETGATVIFCETTPVPAGAKSRVVEDSQRYNAAAIQAMSEVGGIEINPLYEFAKQHAEQKPADVHYTSEGSAKLAEQVANSVRAALAKRK
jgi:hypothetical protein